jgi:ABC-type transporter Mla maintaining outer membrane lipid asymmetry ATPase subunit MlaF
MTRAALSLRHVCVDLAGRRVIDDVSVAFPLGTASVVVGRSGAGKSVLLKAAAGLLPRAAGEVLVHVPPLVFVHQDPALLDDLDVLGNVLLPASAQRLRPRDVLVDDALALLVRLGLRDVARRKPASLSPSQQRRCALARALLLRPGVLIVDEPTTGLDPARAHDVDDALVDVVAPERAVVVVTHHPRTLARLRALRDAQVVVIEAGKALPSDARDGAPA